MKEGEEQGGAWGVPSTRQFPVRLPRGVEQATARASVSVFFPDGVGFAGTALRAGMVGGAAAFVWSRRGGRAVDGGARGTRRRPRGRPAKGVAERGSVWQREWVGVVFGAGTSVRWG